MSDSVSNEKLVEILGQNKEVILSEIKELKAEVKSYTEKHNSLNTQTALLQAEVKRNTESLDSNWEKTRKIDAKILKWGGVISGLSVASGFILKFSF